MTKLKKISIITATLNSEDTIERCIESVLAQNYDCFEHIIVDGGSTDKTLQILQQYSHIKYISEPDKGISDAFNKGFRLSTGEIIGYLNSDDYYLPNAFEKVTPYFNNGSVFVIGKIEVIRNDNSIYINDAQFTFNEMLQHWKTQSFPVNPLGYFYLREIQKEAGGFNVKNKYSMDLEFLLKVSKNHKLTKIKSSDKPLGVFTLNNKSTTKKAMSEALFYSSKNFPYISNYISEYPRVEQKKLKQSRVYGYSQRNINAIEGLLKKVKGFHRFYLIVLRMLLRLRLLMNI